MAIPLNDTGGDARPGGPSIAALLGRAAGSLADSSPTARLDAELLLMHTLGCSRSHLHAWPERTVEPATAARFLALVGRRRQGLPVAQLLGRQGFYGLELRVTEATLIPRPETELVVELALALLAGTPNPRVLDLGTGSGAIALAVAHQRRDAAVDAVEISPPAVTVARENAARLGLSNLAVHPGSWFEPVAGQRYRAVLANPPYVAEEEWSLTSPETRHEPRQALFAAERGLAALRHIAGAAPGHLEAGGWLVLEHGFRQGGPVREILACAGFEAVTTERDLAGHERVTLGRRPATEGHHAG